jgi:hypothetical protein
LSRSWLLANVPVAARALEAVATRGDALLPTNATRHTTLVDVFREAVLKWRSLTEQQLHVPFAVHEAGQTGGRVKRHKSSQIARLPDLLDALLQVYE